MFVLLDVDETIEEIERGFFKVAIITIVDLLIEFIANNCQEFSNFQVHVNQVLEILLHM